VVSFPQVSTPKPHIRFSFHHKGYMPKQFHSSWFYQPHNIGCHHFFSYNQPFSTRQALISAALFVSCRGRIKEQKLNLSHAVCYRHHTQHVMKLLNSCRIKWKHDLWIALWSSELMYHIQYCRSPNWLSQPTTL
jgi:hypothetical protein